MVPPGSRGARKSAYGRLDTLLSEQCPVWRFDSLNPALSSGSWTRIVYALSGSRPERHGLCPRQRSSELTEPNWSKPTWTTSAYVWPSCLERAKAGTATFGCRKLQPGLATHANFTIFEDIQIEVETLLVSSTGRLCTAVEKEQSSATRMMTACEDVRLGLAPMPSRSATSKKHAMRIPFPAWMPDLKLRIECFCIAHDARRAWSFGAVPNAHLIIEPKTNTKVRISEKMSTAEGESAAFQVGRKTP
jgi:hypothetical protein